jgi:hypothetical protein
MTIRASRPRSRFRAIAIGAVAVTLVSLFVGQLEMAALIGGLLIMCVSVAIGSTLTVRAASEVDPGRVLGLDVLLALMVVSGLSGVALIGWALL